MTENRLSQALAQRSNTATTEIINVDQPSIKLVIVTIAGHCFALPGDMIQEILPDMPVFKLPGCPSSMEGVINLRGQIESVIYLHPLLQLPPQDFDHHSRILIVKGAKMRSGIRVNAVLDVIDIVQNSLASPPNGLPEHIAPYINAVLPFQANTITLLDLDKLLIRYADGLG